MANGGQRVLILSASMGGGHLQISRELRRRLLSRGHDAEVIDQLDLMPAPTGDWLGRIYPFLVNRAPGLYQRVYDTFFIAEQRAGERVGIPVRLALRGLRRLVRAYRPDLAVATYPLSALALGELRERGHLRCPALTVVTTFSVNNLWLHPAADGELCISEPAAAEVTRRTGRPATVVGPIIRPGLQHPFGDPALARAELGIDPAQRVALVTTGSQGLAGSASIAATAIAARPGWTPVVLCGRNESLRAALQQQPGVRPLGWVEDMPSVMAAADVLVDNAGGMSSKEALGFGLPIVTFRPLTGHGRDDARAMEQLGLTTVVEEEAHLLSELDRLCSDRQARAARVEHGRDLFVADAADVVEEAMSPVGTVPLETGSPAGSSR